jgi:hypothetical protein
MQQSIPWWSKLQGWQPGWVQLELEPGTQLVPRVMTPDKMMYLPVCRRQTCNHNNCVLTRGFNATKKSGLVPHACVDLTMLQNDTKGANSRQKKQGPEGGQNGRLSRASGPYPRPRVVVHSDIGPVSDRRVLGHRRDRYYFHEGRGSECRGSEC